MTYGFADSQFSVLGTSLVVVNTAVVVLETLCRTCAEAQEAMVDEEEELGDIPDEYLDELTAEFKAANDDYSYIMAEAIADRLAEAFAELMHEKVRKEHWGYAKDETFNCEDLLKVKYQGIRPAPGYPSQPDHTEKATMWDLMKVHEEIGVELTESFAMLPAASVSGLYFAGKCSQYFNVGKITNDQVKEYADRKGQDFKVAEKWLSPVLSYEP